MAQANFEELEKQLKSLFASIPYNNFTGAKLYEYEGYYASVFYAYLKSLGVEAIGEDVTNKGRIDLTLKMPNAIFIFEFKTDEEGSTCRGPVIFLSGRSLIFPTPKKRLSHTLKNAIYFHDCQATYPLKHLFLSCMNYPLSQ